MLELGLGQSTEWGGSLEVTVWKWGQRKEDPRNLSATNKAEDEEGTLDLEEGVEGSRYVVSLPASLAGLTSLFPGNVCCFGVLDNGMSWWKRG